MISFGGYYNFPAENVQYIARTNDGGGEYPYKLTVFFKGGGSASISYSDKITAIMEQDRFVKQMEAEEKATEEKILNAIKSLLQNKEG